MADLRTPLHLRTRIALPPPSVARRQMRSDPAGPVCPSGGAARSLALAIAIALCCAVAGCDRDGADGEQPLGPPTPSGAIDIGGPPMTSTPPPPPGWNLKEVEPQSQQEAQDTLLGYLQRTVQALPGSEFDASRYAGVGSGNLNCADDATGPNAPTQFGFTGDLKLPAGTDAAAAITMTGDTWRGWGWYVFERDGFRKPNQFGYSPDGYRLQIVTAGRDGFPPTLEGTTPCFPGNLARNDIPFPTVVNQ